MAILTAPLSYRLGLQVLDVDLGAPMSDAVFGQVHRAFLDSGGLFAAAGRISTGISSVPSRFVRIATKSCSLTPSCTWMSLARCSGTVLSRATARPSGG